MRGGLIEDKKNELKAPEGLSSSFKVICFLDLMQNT